MKMNLIALAAASAVSSSAVMADAPTLYGKLNLNLASVDGKDTSVNSTASRFGIKGAEDLGNGLKAVYKVEFALNDVSGDKGTKETVSARNQYLGLAGGFGTVLLGKHDTPLKMSQPSDLFNDGAADLGKLTNGVVSGEDRAGDVLAYVSPMFSNFKIIAAAVMGDEKGDDSKDATSIALTYGSTKKGIYGAIANTSSDGISIVRASAQYKAGGLIANVMHNRTEKDGNAADEGSFTHFQAGYKIGKLMPKIKYAMTDRAYAKEQNAFSIGLNYKMGKTTTGYIYTTRADDFDQGSTKVNSTIVGMVHKF